MDFSEKVNKYVSSERYRRKMNLPKEQIETYNLLAQGEYNRNYWFVHPLSAKKLVLRINFGSQMQLQKQAEYEYKALELLQKSGRTPRVSYVDSTCDIIPNGVIVEEFLSGHHMDYNTELLLGAECLADIHSVDVGSDSFLVAPEDPLRAIMDECYRMFDIYRNYEGAELDRIDMIQSMLEKGEELADRRLEIPYKCCINTELNSTNFLINGRKAMNYVVDWEKPVYGDPAQDLGHFLAPTTTYWKTDVILEDSQVKSFVEAYKERVDGRFNTDGLRERTDIYIPLTCLRGITWCAMAKVQYNDQTKAIVNSSTSERLDRYLDMNFLNMIDKNYLG